jgi:FAD/FMN-containing dehydrogenase
MNNKRYQSWGRYPKVEQEALKLYWRDEPLPVETMKEKTFLPFGNGRSYGDVCLNQDGLLLDCRNLDRFIHFDPSAGVLRCESGVLLSEILRLIIPAGWFLPVTPGTQFVTVGGAIANDVHGKNHHTAGTFGTHIRCFELLRSDKRRMQCSPDENAEFFKATIGGLGLTGVITWAEIKLRPISNRYITQEIVRYGNLKEFFALARDSDRSYEYTVAWIDCLAKGADLGRGLFIRGNHAAEIKGKAPRAPAGRINFPVDPSFALINGLTLKLFNTMYYRKQVSKHKTNTVHYKPFFYPLDAVYHWNRIYGSKGFFQYQCAVPADKAEDAVREILQRITHAGLGSFLTVLKLLGEKPSPGLMSFPMPGATLALDFPNNGQKTLGLLDQLYEVAQEAGGRVNPSKDARMPARDFQQNYPNWQNMKAFLDPRISSNFWRRVTKQL